MNNKKNQHVVPLINKWVVPGEGNKKRTAIKDTKAEAIERAGNTAKNQKTELVIHNRDGKISDKDSYGNDPFPARDIVHWASVFF